jgi:folylpolyglutamate synthase/dihydropteroate synthase
MVIEDISDALREAQGIAKQDDLICITGSFFLAGKIKKLL